MSVVMLREIRARRHARRAPTQHFAGARFEGAGKLQADADQQGWIWRGGVARSDLQTAVAAKGHRAIRDRKAERDDFERSVAFEYFGQMLPGELNTQRSAARLDRIARTLVAAPGGRNSFSKARRRLGELRKEFLQLGKLK